METYKLKEWKELSPCYTANLYYRDISVGWFVINPMVWDNKLFDGMWYKDASLDIIKKLKGCYIVKYRCNELHKDDFSTTIEKTLKDDFENCDSVDKMFNLFNPSLEDAKKYVDKIIKNNFNNVGLIYRYKQLYDRETIAGRTPRTKY